MAREWKDHNLKFISYHGPRAEKQNCWDGEPRTGRSLGSLVFVELLH